VVDEQITCAVGLLTITPALIDPHGEPVNRVLVPVRGKISRSLEVRSVFVSAAIVDATRDFESFIAATVIVATIVPIGPILMVRAAIVPVKAFVLLVLAMLSLVHSLPVVMAIMRLDGRGEHEGQQKRPDGEDDGCDSFHG
jgi:hypothetical protein